MSISHLKNQSISYREKEFRQHWETGSNPAVNTSGNTTFGPDLPCTEWKDPIPSQAVLTSTWVSVEQDQGCTGITLPRKVMRRARPLDEWQAARFCGEPGFLDILLQHPTEPLRVNHYQFWLEFCQAIRVALMGCHVTCPPVSSCFLGRPRGQKEAEPTATVTPMLHAPEPSLGTRRIPP